VTTDHRTAVSDSSSAERCFFKVFTVQQFTHCDDKEFQPLTTLLLKANFLTSNLKKVCFQ